MFDVLSIVTTPDMPDSSPQKDIAALYLKNYIMKTFTHKGAGKQAYLQTDLQQVA